MAAENGFDETLEVLIEGAADINLQVRSSAPAPQPLDPAVPSCSPSALLFKLNTSFRALRSSLWRRLQIAVR